MTHATNYQKNILGIHEENDIEQLHNEPVKYIEDISIFLYDDEIPFVNSESLVSFITKHTIFYDHSFHTCLNIKFAMHSFRN